MNETFEVRQEQRKYEAEQKAKALVDSLSSFINGVGIVGFDAFATALANEHPTLLGQIAKAVGIGVMRRALYDPEWKPFNSITPKDKSLCRDRYGDLRNPQHADHDGRLDCSTVIGAELMARQSFI